MEELSAAGLGLEHNVVRLTSAGADWVHLGTNLAATVAALLDDRAVEVVHIGSASVPGLLCKPILDLAVGTADEPELEAVREPLEAAGWIFRGDAGDEGGLVFVLESRPGHRVAHIHVVVHDGTQWRNYLTFQALLRRDPTARATYEATKRELAARPGIVGRSYTSGKHDTVERLLSGWEATEPYP